jgi:hypothetical protein
MVNAIKQKPKKPKPKAKRPTVLPDAPRPSRRLDDSAWRTPLNCGDAAAPKRERQRKNCKLEVEHGHGVPWVRVPWGE